MYDLSALGNSLEFQKIVCDLIAFPFFVMFVKREMCSLLRYLLFCFYFVQSRKIDLTCSSGAEGNHSEIMKSLITLVSFKEIILKLAINDWIYAGGCELYTILFNSIYYNTESFCVLLMTGSVEQPSQ